MLRRTNWTRSGGPGRGVFFALSALGLFLTSACEDEVVPTHSIRVSVKDDMENPLPGAQVELGGAPVGTTDASGVVALTKTAVDGTRLAGKVHCPEGYEPEVQPFQVLLTRVRALGSEDIAPILQSAACRPSQREAVILVSAGFAGLGVEVDGKRVAQTDANGYAHIHLKRKPEARVGVALKTDEFEKLRPVNPSTTFEIGDSDEVLVYSQEFQEEKKKKRRVVRVKKPEKHIPVRL